MTQGPPSRQKLMRGARSIALATMAVLFLCASAEATTTGYLYSALGTKIETFAVATDTSLTYQGSITGGAATTDYPGSLVMARTANGMNLYQLSGTGSTQTIHQYSINPSTGNPTAKSPASVGSVPLLESGEMRFLAMYNPAASGSAGQNALYVLSGPSRSSAAIYIFHLNPTTGALTAAGSVPVPGVTQGVSLGYSGRTLVVDGTFWDGNGTQTVFQTASINASTATPVFRPTANAPCDPSGSVCNDGPIYVMNSSHLLAAAVLLDTKGPPGTYESGVEAYATYTINSLGSTITQPRYGPRDITSNGTAYFTTESDPVSTDPDYGDSWFEQFNPHGGSEGTQLLPAGSNPGAIFALGSGLYIANVNNADTAYADGLAYKLTPGKLPTRTPLPRALGDAITGF